MPHSISIALPLPPPLAARRPAPPIHYCLHACMHGLDGWETWPGAGRRLGSEPPIPDEERHPPLRAALRCPPQGYAYIEFFTPAQASKALALSGSLLLGRPIKVVGRSSRPGPPSALTEEG